MGLQGWDWNQLYRSADRNSLYVIHALDVCEDSLDGELDAAGDVASGWALCCCNNALYGVEEDSISSGWVTSEQALGLRIHTCSFRRRRRPDATLPTPWERMARSGQAGLTLRRGEFRIPLQPFDHTQENSGPCPGHDRHLRWSRGPPRNHA